MVFFRGVDLGGRGAGVIAQLFRIILAYLRGIGTPSVICHENLGLNFAEDTSVTVSKEGMFLLNFMSSQFLLEFILTLHCNNLFHEFSITALIFMNFPLDKRFSRALSLARCWAQWVNPSTPRRGCGTTGWWAASSAASWTPTGRRRRAATSSPRYPGPSKPNLAPPASPSSA
jgi:hypothetical protein